MRGAFDEIIGKTIKQVVITGGERPNHQAFLVFTDGTHFEFYGSHFQAISEVLPGDLAELKKNLSVFGRTSIEVIPKEEEVAAPAPKKNKRP